MLGPLPVECLLAAGQSQSAIHLVTYVNAVAPTVPPEAACDGYLIGSRTGFAAPLTGWDGRIRSGGPDGARVRTDGRAPVLTLQTESDVTGVLAGVTARQPDSSRFRWWEIAGAAHADTYVLGAAFSDSGDLPPAELVRRYPAGPGEYAAAFREATTHAAAAGFVLEQDVEEMVAVATAAYPA